MLNNSLDLGRPFTSFPKHPKLFSSLEISAFVWALDLGISTACVFESPLKGIPSLPGVPTAHFPPNKSFPGILLWGAAHSAGYFPHSVATLAWYCAVPAVPKVTSLRPLQNRKINSQYRVWVLKSPHHAHPKEVAKKHHGNRTPILRIMAMQVRYCEPPYNSVPVLKLVLFGLCR